LTFCKSNVASALASRLPVPVNHVLHVLHLRTDEQVVGVDANPIIAGMPNEQAIRNVANKLAVGRPRRYFALSKSITFAIAACEQGAHPQPTAAVGLRDALVEELLATGGGDEVFIRIYHGSIIAEPLSPVNP
jgi:hypothetical protein